MVHVRKGVMAVTLVVGFGAASALGAGIARGDLPMNIALSGQSFSATIGSLSGTSIAIYPRQVSTSGGGERSGAQQSMAIKLGTATLTDLCLSMVAHGIPVVGDATITLRAPGPSTRAENLVIDATGLGGSIGARNVVIGADFSPTDKQAASMGTGIVAESSTLTDAHLTATALRASSLTLTTFDVSIDKGARRC